MFRRIEVGSLAGALLMLAIVCGCERKPMTKDELRDAIRETMQAEKAEREKERPARDRIATNETSAVASLVVILSGQATFHRTDFYGAGALQYANPTTGRGFSDLYSTNGKTINLISRQLAEAVKPEQAKAGYYFIDLVGGSYGEYDGQIEFGVCAVPAKYGVTGRNTFLMDVGGTIYQKDTGGVPPKDRLFPNTDKDNWRAVGSE